MPGTFRLVAELTGGGASYNFTSLSSSTYDIYYILGSVKSTNTAATSSRVQLQINGSGGGNYAQGWLLNRPVSGSTNYAWFDNTYTSWIPIGMCTTAEASNVKPNMYGHFETIITNANTAGGTYPKGFVGRGGHTVITDNLGTTSYTYGFITGGGTGDHASSISSMLFYPEVGNFTSASVITIYGLTSA